MKDNPFRENVTIITGASYGIGEALALQLAGQGAWLALAARSAGRLREITDICIQRGGRAIFVPTDVSQERSCRGLVECTVEEYGRIDTLVNNAGTGMDVRFDELKDLELYQQVFGVNFFGSVYCTFHALPYLKQTRGRLAAVASGRGLFPSARADPYGPSKHAMLGFFNSLRNELRGSGVSVTLIVPEWVSTGITSRALRADGTAAGVISRHEINSMTPETCARIMARAMAERKREVIMSAMMKLGLWLWLIAPGLVDRVMTSKTD